MTNGKQGHRISLGLSGSKMRNQVAQVAQVESGAAKSVAEPTLKSGKGLTTLEEEPDAREW